MVFSNNNLLWKLVLPTLFVIWWPTKLDIIIFMDDFFYQIENLIKYILFIWWTLISQHYMFSLDIYYLTYFYFCKYNNLSCNNYQKKKIKPLPKFHYNTQILYNSNSMINLK
jgi:hypothetical protein